MKIYIQHNINSEKPGLFANTNAVYDNVKRLPIVGKTIVGERLAVMVADVVFRTTCEKSTGPEDDCTGKNRFELHQFEFAREQMLKYRKPLDPVPPLKECYRICRIPGTGNPPNLDRVMLGLSYHQLRQGATLSPQELYEMKEKMISPSFKDRQKQAIKLYTYLSKVSGIYSTVLNEINISDLEYEFQNNSKGKKHYGVISFVIDIAKKYFYPLYSILGGSEKEIELIDTVQDNYSSILLLQMQYPVLRGFKGFFYPDKRGQFIDKLREVYKDNSDIPPRDLVSFALLAGLTSKEIIETFKLDSSLAKDANTNDVEKVLIYLLEKRCQE